MENSLSTEPRSDPEGLSDILLMMSPHLWGFPRMSVAQVLVYSIIAVMTLENSNFLIKILFSATSATKVHK